MLKRYFDVQDDRQIPHISVVFRFKHVSNF